MALVNIEVSHREQHYVLDAAPLLSDNFHLLYSSENAPPGPVSASQNSSKNCLERLANLTAFTNLAA